MWPRRTVPSDRSAVAPIAGDVQHERAEQLCVRQIELYHEAEDAVYCLLEGPEEQTVRHHHAALGVDRGEVHRADGLT